MNTDHKSTLERAALVGTTAHGLSAVTSEGKPARIAIIDDDGNILEAGEPVAAACWHVVSEVQNNIWLQQGHLVVVSNPVPLMPHTAKRKAA